MDQVCVGGIDATADALDQMEQGNLDVTVFQDAKGQGRGAIDAAVKLAKGEKVDQFVMIPYELVTPENMKSYSRTAEPEPIRRSAVDSAGGPSRRTARRRPRDR